MKNFEKFLFVWVLLCMGLGLLLSLTVPGLGETIDSWQVRGISIPIGICLFLMMYPALMNLQMSEVKKIKQQPKPILLSLFSNWLIAPIVGMVLARIFLKGNEQLMVAVILLTASPCTAMVLVWSKLAQGNQEQNVVNTSINTITILFLYAPVVALLTGIQNIPIDRGVLLISTLVFIGLPLILAAVSKRFFVRQKGQEWFDGKYRPAVEKVSIGALLMTLVVLFSLNGAVLLNNFDKLLLVSVPLLLGFVIVVGYNLIITRLFGLQYREAITTVLIGSSSHFEIAIATAVSIYGVGSMAALGTTMGLFWEVPVMLGLVYFGRFLGKRGFWGKPAIELGKLSLAETEAAAD